MGESWKYNPHLALHPNMAVEIMFEGMTKGNSSFGDFTGKALETYFNDKKEDWVNARRIINGTDCAKMIREFAKQFYAALKSPVSLHGTKKTASAPKTRSVSLPRVITYQTKQALKIVQEMLEALKTLKQQKRSTAKAGNKK
jgi:hypothetical protein